MMVSFFLCSVLAVALPPLGLILPPHELVKLIVMPLSFPLFIFPTVILISLPAPMLFSLLLVTLRLTSSGQNIDCRNTRLDTRMLVAKDLHYKTSWELFKSIFLFFCNTICNY